MSPRGTRPGRGDWKGWNRLFLDAQVLRLRLVLARRVLWLRSQLEVSDAQDAQASPQSLSQADTELDRLIVGEDFDAERAFYETDEEATNLAAQIETAQQLATSRAGSAEREGAPPALLTLCELFDLSPF